MVAHPENKYHSLFNQFVENYTPDADQNEVLAERIIGTVRELLSVGSKTSTIAAYLIIRQYGDAIAEVCRALPTPFVSTKVVFETDPATRQVTRAGKLVAYHLSRRPLHFSFPAWATAPLLLANLYTTEETRRRGVAKQLIGRVVTGNANAKKQLFATTSPDNTASQASFKAHGFQIERHQGGFSKHIRLYRSPEQRELRTSMKREFAGFDPFADLDQYGRMIGLRDSEPFDLRDCFSGLPINSVSELPVITQMAMDALRRSIYLPSWLLAYRDETTPRHDFPILAEVRRSLDGKKTTHEPVAYVIPETLATYPKTFAWSTPEMQEQRDFAGHTFVVINPKLTPEQVWELLTSYWPEMGFGRWFTIAQVSPRGRLPGSMPDHLQKNEQIVMMQHPDPLDN